MTAPGGHHGPHSPHSPHGPHGSHAHRLLGTGSSWRVLVFIAACVGATVCVVFALGYGLFATHEMASNGLTLTSGVAARIALSTSFKSMHEIENAVRVREMAYDLHEFAALRNLIMCAGHTVYKGTSYDRDSIANESNWVLERNQVGQLPAYLAHIRTSVELAAKDPLALLLFSGGQTRRDAGPTSEAQTYWKTAQAFDWYGLNARDSPHAVSHRIFTEEFARDSFENLLFSVCRFREMTGHYPDHLTVVSFGFKERRFRTLHRQALRWPAERFHYVGVDLEPPSKALIDGEQANAANLFREDPYGCDSPTLVAKRKGRNPWLRFMPYPDGCPEIAEIFVQCGRVPFEGPLPW
ncbi:hypothetical protein FVE85_6459 [Porphyridium purpureum]|uniref:DUF218 domain-containing protein n=1 Tax=Porphyridium purpureum TaxID=35688 RepID=A0A5J4Z7C2_PORPP|nr:hypothetical protein FVE85_6459 [Porphyridium purpureum]|eukprot:POR2820..scf295_1